MTLGLWLIVAYVVLTYAVLAFAFAAANGTPEDETLEDETPQWARDGDGLGEDAVKASYRDSFARLGEVKRKHDPGDLFGVNRNIRTT